MVETRIETLIKGTCSEVARGEEEACKQTLNGAYAVEEVNREKYDRAFEVLFGSTYDACNVSANNTDRLIATCFYKNFQSGYSRARPVTYGIEAKKAVEHLADIKTKYQKEYAEAEKKKAAAEEAKKKEAEKVAFNPNAGNTISEKLTDASAKAKLAELVGICSSVNPVSQPCLTEFQRAMTQLLNEKGDPAGMAAVLKGEVGFYFRVGLGGNEVVAANVGSLKQRLAEIAGGEAVQPPSGPGFWSNLDLGGFYLKLGVGQNLPSVYLWDNSQFGELLEPDKGQRAYTGFGKRGLDPHFVLEIGGMGTPTNGLSFGGGVMAALIIREHRSLLAGEDKFDTGDGRGAQTVTSDVARAVNDASSGLTMTDVVVLPQVRARFEFVDGISVVLGVGAGLLYRDFSGRVPQTGSAQNTGHTTADLSGATAIWGGSLGIELSRHLALMLHGYVPLFPSNTPVDVNGVAVDQSIRNGLLTLEGGF